jgi:ParB family chromosome partitioning protein
MTMKRKVLGKGIDAIISNRPTASEEKGYVEIDIDDIYPNPYQPRKKFSTEKIKDLAASLKEAGMIQPVVIFKEDAKYYLMVGERRWRAAQYLKWKKIPAIIKDVIQDDILVSALVENIQREDLNPIEIAEGIEVLMQQMELTQERASERLGMNRSTLTNYLRLLKLPEAVKESVISGDISQGHARAILSLEDNTDILDALSKILKNHLSVRQTEKMVKGLNKEKIPKTPEEQDPDIRRTEEKLARLLATKVKLNYLKNGRGKIEIFFNQLEEFERIYNLLIKDKE